jgi:Hemerythrin HHE cation binding domain
MSNDAVYAAGSDRMPFGFSSATWAGWLDAWLVDGCRTPSTLRGCRSGLMRDPPPALHIEIAFGRSDQVTSRSGAGTQCYVVVTPDTFAPLCLFARRSQDNSTSLTDRVRAPPRQGEEKGAGVDALEELRQMHVEAKARFEKIETSPAAERGALWAELKPQLELHEQIEERFVYDPVAREAGRHDEVLARWEREHEEQVREADEVMRQIGTLDPSDDLWVAMVGTLGTTLQDHIQHEEDDIWPRIREAWGQPKLEEAGRAISAAKAASNAGAAVTDAVAKGGEQLRER